MEISHDDRKMSYSPDSLNLPPPLTEPQSALTTLGSEQYGASGGDFGSNIRQRQPAGDSLVGSQIDQRRKSYYPHGTTDRAPTLTDAAGDRVALESEQFENDIGRNKMRNHNTDPNASNTKDRFFRGMKSLWMTKDTEDIKNDRRLFIKTTIRELVVYSVFLLILCVIAFSMTSPTAFYLTEVITNLFVNDAPQNTPAYSSIETMDDIWNYLDNQFIQAIYWNNTYLDPENVSENSMVYYENKLLGTPRIRMLKVNNKSCEVVNSFRREITQCFGKYQEDQEDQLPIGSGGNGTAFEYQSEEVLESGTYWGQISTYGGGGFVQDLSMTDPNETLALIAELKANRWIDRGTRVVFIDFILYNANVNLFCIVKLVLEIPSTGGVIPNYQIDTLKLIRYVDTHVLNFKLNFFVKIFLNNRQNSVFRYSSYDHVILVLEAIFCAFVIYYIIEEVIEIVKWRLSYFKTIWNLLDIIVLVTAGVTIFFGIRVTILVKNKLKELSLDLPHYENMHKIISAQTVFNDFFAVLVFFAWIKIFKYISFNKTMNQLSETLNRSAKDIGGFSVMFFIFFFAYAQFGYLVFGTQIQDYSTFYEANLALLRLILGDFDFHALENANRILGPIFFITYVFFVFFVLLNMFLAIINDSYIEVKTELHKQKSELQVTEFVSQQYYRALKGVGLAQGIESVNPQMEYDIWKDELRRRGFTEREINEKFIKFDISGEQFVTNDQRQLVEHELNSERAPEDPQNQGRLAILAKGRSRENAIVERRVDQIENAIMLVTDRIEAIIAKLEEVENEKIAQSEAQNELEFEAEQNRNIGNYLEMQSNKKEE